MSFEQVLAIGLGLVTLLGVLWKVGRAVWRIEDQVTNHIPSKIQKVERKVDANTRHLDGVRRELEAHEERETVYWRVIERHLNGDP
jgi:hypothetical protein